MAQLFNVDIRTVNEHLNNIYFQDELGRGATARRTVCSSTLCLYKAGYDFKRLFTISEYYDRDRPGLLQVNPERA